ncbi:MYXO-CTERM sorting domain-containing protein [Nannocystis pusilla]|uniref:MYXO-CTERM sorting domain-containing protein n=1 Tax=Nannocystis pusilla TaxID=889268 RepID=UPI003DA441EB
MEAAYADGQLVVVSGPVHGEEAKIPPGPLPVALTPVAADGTRGATVSLTEADIAPDPDAGSGCRMGGGGVAPALWLLGPLAWTFTRRRRR